MIVAASFFFASLAGLALLFTLKAVEARRGSVYLPTLRRFGDDYARSMKALLLSAAVLFARMPPMIVLLVRFVLHELALGAARLARLAEAQSHRIADLVSHKRSFEKRTDKPNGPRSEFLKQVGDVKNGARDERGEL
jgi:hypothetical protein